MLPQQITARPSKRIQSPGAKEGAHPAKVSSPAQRQRGRNLVFCSSLAPRAAVWRSTACSRLGGPPIYQSCCICSAQCDLAFACIGRAGVCSRAFSLEAIVKDGGETWPGLSPRAQRLYVARLPSGGGLPHRVRVLSVPRQLLIERMYLTAMEGARLQSCRSW